MRLIMSHCAHAALRSDPAACGEERGFGPPLPLKLLLAGAAFLICPPLGLLALGFLAWRYFGWGHGCGDRHRGFRHSTGNSALDAKRRETLQALDEEAEAFVDFARRERERRDREAYERFQAERNAKKEG
jgi:Protein of unknown function (DUF2852)